MKQTENKEEDDIFKPHHMNNHIKSDPPDPVKQQDVGNMLSTGWPL